MSAFVLLLGLATAPAGISPAQKPDDLVRLRDAMACVAAASPVQTAKVLDSDFTKQPAYNHDNLVFLSRKLLNVGHEFLILRSLCKIFYIFNCLFNNEY